MPVATFGNCSLHAVIFRLFGDEPATQRELANAGGGVWLSLTEAASRGMILVYA